METVLAGLGVFLLLGCGATLTLINEKLGRVVGILERLAERN
jgi:hypothetical protein